jgi:putative inorganic carbon (hco3(-)) transporter
MVFVILLATVIVIIWSVKNPFVGLLGVLMLNILRPGEIYPAFAALHLERITAIVVILSTLAHYRKLQTPKITKTVLLFWGTMILSIPLAFWKGNSVSMCIQFGQTIVYHLLIVTLLTTAERFRAFLITFSILIGWLAATSFYLYVAGNYIVRMGIDRAVGLTSAGDDPNTLANTLVSGLPLIALLLTKDSTKKIKLLGLGVGCTAAMTVIFTGSRMGFFSMTVLFLAFVATRHKKFIYIPAMFVFLLVAWIFIPQQYKERYATVNNLEQDQSYQNRVRAWQAGWAMFKANPITGMGAGNFTFAAGSEYWPGPGKKIWLNAHSLPLKALGDLGLVGTVAFIFMVVTLFKLNGQLKRQLEHSGLHSMLRFYPAACNFCLVVLIFAGYTNHNLYRNTWFMLAATSGAMQLLLESRALAADEAQNEFESRANKPAYP